MKKATLILLVLLLCCGVAAPAAAEQGEAPRPEQNAGETVVRESGEPDPAVPAPVQTPEPDPELTFPDGSVHHATERRVDLSEIRHDEVEDWVEISVG